MNKKVALVTGASDGIGKGIALELARAGYDLMIHSARSIEKARSLCLELTRDYGCTAFDVQADLMESGSSEVIFRAFDSHYDRLDLYVNNAGVTEGAPFLQMTEETLDRVLTINFKGAYLCAQNAARRMVKKSIPGNIIIISSNQQEMVMARSSVYGPVKSALTRLSKHLAIELAQFGIRVNTIAPGYVDSTERMHQAKVDTDSMAFIPLKRWAEVEEIGKAVLYLTSPDAAFITGSCLVMDGGATIRHYPMEYFTQENPIL